MKRTITIDNCLDCAQMFLGKSGDVIVDESGRVVPEMACYCKASLMMQNGFKSLNLDDGLGMRQVAVGSDNIRDFTSIPAWCPKFLEEEEVRRSKKMQRMRTGIQFKLVK